MKKKGKWSTLILLFIFFIGLSVMLYPSVSSYWNSRTQSETIVDYIQMLESIPKENYSEYFKAAEEYNTKLSTLSFPLIEYGEIDGYDNILNLSGNGMIGYLTIEKLGINLPLFHGTDDNVLNNSVGHLKGSSIPIGGIGTHSVVSAHRGLPTSTLFTNLDHLEVGDTFEFTILDRTVTYIVDQIKTVEPTDTADLQIENNKDYCTLLTCTPYGINTHRLLVRGKRIDTFEEKNIYITSDAFQISTFIVTPIVALPILIVLMLIVLLKPIKKDDLEGDIL